MGLDQPVIVFDGVCNLCNAAVDFIVRQDSEEIFQFASNQSEPGQAIASAAGVLTFDTDTIVLGVGDQSFVRSDAVLEIASRLGWPWKAASILRVIPRPVRDAAYKLLAANRYRLFGQRETCRVPTPKERSRFLG